MKIKLKFDKRFWIIFLSLVFMLLLMHSVRWIFHNFHRVNFDEIAIVLSSGMGVGTDSGMLMSFIKNVILRSLSYSFIVAFILQIIRKPFMVWAVYIIFSVLLVQSILVSNVEFGSFFNFDKSNFYETEFVDPTDVSIQWKKHRNVVFVALESIEKIYGTNEISGEILTPNITQLEKHNISFEDYQSMSGLSHTIAAITGFTTGLPLFFTRSKGIEKMKGAYGIGSIFKNAGYQTWSIFPATGKFSLKSDFMHKKGFDNVIDGVAIRKNLANPPKEKPYQGVDDGTLFEYSKPIIKNIIKTKQPYFIFLETINTHCSGFFTEYCKKIGFRQETIEDIIKCDDKIIYDFVQWMRKADPTAVIILINDHKQHSGVLTEQLEQLENRPLSNVFINTNIFKGADMNKPVSAIDFFPTVVEAAGGEISGCKLGLGVSLSARCKNVQTLRERFPTQELETIMETKNDLYYYLATGKKKK